jgi:hypothetical protein
MIFPRLPLHLMKFESIWGQISWLVRIAAFMWTWMDNGRACQEMGTITLVPVNASKIIHGTWSIAPVKNNLNYFLAFWKSGEISYGFWPWPTFQGHGGQTSKIYTICDTTSQVSPHRLFNRSIKLKLSHVLGTHRLMCTTPLEFRSNSVFFHHGRYVKTHFWPLLHYKYLW